MTNNPTGIADHNGGDDFLPDTGLDHVLANLAKVPEEFDVSSMQGHNESVTVTFRFPVLGPDAQLAAIEGLIQAALCTGTLARNLKHERSMP